MDAIHRVPTRGLPLFIRLQGIEGLLDQFSTQFLFILGQQLGIASYMNDASS
jgi:hypothetical protein